MHDFLSVNKMAGGLDFVKKLTNIGVPLVEGIVGEFLLPKGDFSGHPVDLSVNSFVHDHVSDFNLSSLLRNADQLAESRQLDLAVISLKNADVVLDHLSDQVAHV